MPDDAQVCPQCAAPVQNDPVPPPPAAAAPPPPPSAWLNVPPAQPQYAPQGQFYPGQGQPYAQPAQTDTKATVSLVLGIISILCFGVLTGIPAIILGHISRGNISRSMGRLSGGGMALTGLILGYCSLVFSTFFIAAIMIPNLLRARNAANESAAASTVRTLNTSQVTYITMYPGKGYAPDLATLGPGQSGSCAGTGAATAEHACLIDAILGRYTCTAGSWCTKGAYKYSMAAEEKCDEPAPGQERAQHCNYVVVATPVNESMGTKSYCSVADAVVRVRYGRVSQPITGDECETWNPVK
jgi:type II secretory pathway pseudopilin PulG